ncbi:10122_t:CDS:1, partial [Dentiscutata heterogama]
DLTNEKLDKNGEYLMVKLVDDVGQSLADVRNLSKRKQNYMINECPNKKERTQKVLEVKYDKQALPLGQKRRSKETVTKYTIIRSD